MGNIFRATCGATMLHSKLRWFVVGITTQHENLLRKKVVIRATNHLNLQRNIVARQIAQKMLLVLLGLNGRSSKKIGPESGIAPKFHHLTG